MRTRVRDVRDLRASRCGAALAFCALLSTTLTLVLTATLVTLVTLVPTRAHADDRWTTPFPGVRHLVRTSSGPRRIHALEIDLCRAGVSVRASASGERRQSVPSFATSVGAQAAVNGDFFSYDTYAPSGVAAGNGGAMWGGTDSSDEAVLAFGREEALLATDNAIIDRLEPWMAQVVSGHPALVRDGAAVTYGARELCTTRHPRTMAGLSHDRRTLYLAVVDGRSSVSIGMSCGEEAAFMRELGAWDAVNLDGGGSSTMWIRGAGVVNQPSDGAPRVVGNHLAIFARGSGNAESCRPWEESELALGVQGTLDGATSDLDGDGRADLCVRAGAGIRCYRSDGAAFGAPIVGPELSDDHGWKDATNFETIALGDLDGDGLADLCARANVGMRCWRSTGAGFEDAAIAGPELSDATGWNRPERYGTIRLADFDGDGMDDLCARGAAGFFCARSTGAGFDAPTAPLAALSDDEGFESPSYWSTVRMADVDGDGRADVCARNADGIACFASTGVGFVDAPIAGPRWSDMRGWTAHRFYSTIRIADVDADGYADICARASASFRCHLGDGAGFGPAIELEPLADAHGYADIDNYATIRLADIDGDRDLDVCVRRNVGIACYPFLGDAWGDKVDGPNLSDESGWDRAKFYRTIRFADLDGDGDDDLCARAARGILCWPATADGFGPRFDGPTLSDDTGWAGDAYHTTMRFAGPRRAIALPMTPGSMSGDDAGVDVHVDAGVGAGEVDAGFFGDASASIAPGSGTMTGGCAVARPRPTSSTRAWMIALLLLLPLWRAAARSHRR